MNIETKTMHETLRLLRLFKSIPYPLLAHFFQKMYRINLMPYMLTQLTQAGYIYFDQKNEYCYLTYGDKPDFNSACCFSCCTGFLEDRNDRIQKGAYPSDYVLENKDGIYQVINFSENGERKLSFRKQMDRSVLSYSTPVIILVNEDLERFSARDDAGHFLYVPDDDYVLANLRYRPDLDSKQRYRVTFKRFEGGSLIAENTDKSSLENVDISRLIGI